MIFDDAIDAIAAAVLDAERAGHDLAGFTRRTGTFGYRFVARCRRCGHEIAVQRGPGGWDYPPVQPTCFTKHRPAGGSQHVAATPSFDSSA